MSCESVGKKRVGRQIGIPRKSVGPTHAFSICRPTLFLFAAQHAKVASPGKRHMGGREEITPRVEIALLGSGGGPPPLCQSFCLVVVVVGLLGSGVGTLATGSDTLISVSLS
jgi:hypothetical protein